MGLHSIILVDIYYLRMKIEYSRPVLFGFLKACIEFWFSGNPYLII